MLPELREHSADASSIGMPKTTSTSLFTNSPRTCCFQRAAGKLRRNAPRGFLPSAKPGGCRRLLRSFPVQTTPSASEMNLWSITSRASECFSEDSRSAGPCERT
eukprot:4229455-Pyramimonas_sp.AAC.1